MRNSACYCTLHLQNHAGFDPLRLGATDKAQLAWYREGELYNGRWAMAAVAGILFTDALGLPKFWEAGAEVRGGEQVGLVDVRWGVFVG
jgi:hypothetical protein